MTSPIVTEIPPAPQPVERDTFGDLAPSERAQPSWPAPRPRPAAAAA